MDVTATYHNGAFLPHTAYVGTLAQIAHSADFLAMELTASHRSLAYRLKAEAVNALILGGVANLTGLRSRWILELHILTDPPSRLCILLWHLESQAQAVIRKQAHENRILALHFERLNGDLIRSLTEHFYRETVQAHGVIDVRQGPKGLLP